MSYCFENDRPIYIQLLEKIKIDIVSEKIKPGEKVFSVRELALLYKVNPNTVQKSLEKLEEEGLIYTERTNGKFVTEDKELITKVKEEFAKEKVNKYLTDMQNLGFDFDDAVKYLNELGGKNGTVRI